MAYYSGTAASLTALRDALLAHAQADGWVLTGDVLSKAGVYFQIQVTATNITCKGAESNAMLNPAPQPVMIGRIHFYSGKVTREMSFPCNYEVFGFAQELYLVVNYDTSFYQWMAFGKSTVPGLVGNGGWFGATVGGVPAGNYYYTDLIRILATDINSWAGPGDTNLTTAILFGCTSPNYATTADASRNAWVNANLDANGWYPGVAGSAAHTSMSAISQLLWQQPSAWNSEAALLPIRAWAERPSYKLSMVADLEHARHLRIDNHNPGDILTLGADKWKVFPWYSKDLAARNGGTNINHTGTFGWAIRYQGP